MAVGSVPWGGVGESCRIGSPRRMLEKAVGICSSREGMGKTTELVPRGGLEGGGGFTGTVSPD
jgi:hypothetical protein